MVSILKTAVFVHVPKNAGSAISYALQGVDQYWPMHVPWRCLTDIGKPGFGFIRNPWHRMVSLYYFLCTSPPHHERRVQSAEVRAMGFKRWLLEGENWMSNEPIDGDIWIRQNRKYLPVGPGNWYHNIEKLEHPTLGLPPQQQRPAMWWLDGLPPENIGKVESLEDDLAGIATRLWFPACHVPARNITRSKPKDWRSEHDAETIDFIAHYHALDIAAGGYKFEAESCLQTNQSEAGPQPV